jgi:hypothetical protein
MNRHNALRNNRIQLCEVEGNRILLRSYRLTPQPARAYLYAILPTNQYDGRVLKITDYKLAEKNVIVSFLLEWDDKRVITLISDVKARVVVSNPPRPGFTWNDEQSYWENTKGTRAYYCPK